MGIARIERHAMQTLRDIRKEAEEVAVRGQAKGGGIPLDVALSKLREKWVREESIVQEKPSGNVSVHEQDATLRTRSAASIRADAKAFCVGSGSNFDWTKRARQVTQANGGTRTGQKFKKPNDVLMKFHSC